RRRDHLAALPELEEQRPVVAGHRGGAGQDPAERRDLVHAHERRDEPLEHVEQEHGQAETRAVGSPDVRGAGRTAPVAPYVLAVEQPNEPVAPRTRAEQISGGDDCSEGHSLTTWRGEHILPSKATEKGETMAFELPPLPYDFDALEPTIDAKTMEIHHGKHHQAYVTNLNAALEGTEWADKTIDEVLTNLNAIPEDKRAAVRNNGGGH